MLNDKKINLEYLHIISNTSILVDDCPSNVAILPNTNGNATFFTKEFLVCFSLVNQKKEKKGINSLIFSDRGILYMHLFYLVVVSSHE